MESVGQKRLKGNNETEVKVDSASKKFKRQPISIWTGFLIGKHRNPQITVCGLRVEYPDTYNYIFGKLPDKIIMENKLPRRDGGISIWMKGISMPTFRFTPFYPESDRLEATKMKTEYVNLVKRLKKKGLCIAFSIAKSLLLILMPKSMYLNMDSHFLPIEQEDMIGFFMFFPDVDQPKEPEKE